MAGCAVLIAGDLEYPDAARRIALRFLSFFLAGLYLAQSAMADTGASTPRAGVSIRHEAGAEPDKSGVPPRPPRCLLALGDAPLRKKLLPGISKGTVDPGAARAADPSVKTRTWSAPSQYEPEIMLHYVEISSSRFQVLGVYSNAPPYGIDTLTLRDPTVALVCGLRVGQPVDRFIKALGQPPESLAGEEIEYDWDKYALGDGFEFAWHANIVLRLGPKRVVQEVRWEYYAD
jgi:hypothetical protein